MSKKSKMARNQRQLELIERNADLRKSLKEKGDYQALRKLPRDSNPKSTEIPRPDRWPSACLYAKIRCESKYFP